MTLVCLQQMLLQLSIALFVVETGGLVGMRGSKGWRETYSMDVSIRMKGMH